MKLYEKINADFLEARKQRNSAKSSLLGTLKGQLQTVADGKPESLDDSKIVKEIQKMAKSVEETLRVVKEDNPNYAKLQMELETLQAYLPKMMSESELEKLVDSILQETGITDIKQMGVVMGKLKSAGPAVDMKIASKLVRDKLNAG